MNYDDYVAQDRRLAALRILHKLPERRANQFVLRSVLKASGYDELPETVENDVRFLARQNTVQLEELPGGILLAKLSPFGEQVATGVATASGIARPVE